MLLSRRHRYYLLLLSMGKDFGISYTSILYTGATAGKGTTEKGSRQGSTPRHHFWVQWKLYDKAFKIEKIKDRANLQDGRKIYRQSTLDEMRWKIDDQNELCSYRRPM